MIATGTDVKPLEVLLFMRDVKSVNYFEQMKGRGTRTISKDAFQKVSKTAKAKTHFIIVDAVGVTKSKKTDSRPLERKPTIALKDLLGAVTMGVVEENLFLSLANRLIRMNRQITDTEKEKLLEYSKGKKSPTNLQRITFRFRQRPNRRKNKAKNKCLPYRQGTPCLQPEPRKHRRLRKRSTPCLQPEPRKY